MYKMDDGSLFTNYRPIALLPSISKAIFQQVYHIFQAQKLFYDSQYLFRTKHSTEFAALEVRDRVMASMDRNYVPFNIYEGRSINKVTGPTTFSKLKLETNNFTHR